MSIGIQVAIGVFVALAGTGGILAFALRYNREDSQSLVGTMREVSAELRLDLERLTAERDGLRDRVEELSDEIVKLRQESELLRHELSNRGLVARTAPGGAPHADR